MCRLWRRAFSCQVAGTSCSVPLRECMCAGLLLRQVLKCPFKNKPEENKEANRYYYDISVDGERRRGAPCMQACMK